MNKDLYWAVQKHESREEYDAAIFAVREHEQRLTEGLEELLGIVSVDVMLHHTIYATKVAELYAPLYQKIRRQQAET